MANKSILVVEDDENLVFIYSQVLGKAGYEVHVAMDGIIAMDVARKQRPGLVILDFMFPAGGGGAFHKRLRLSTFTMTTPILIISSAPEDEVRKSVAFDPLTYYQGKPYRQDELLKKIGEILSGDAAPQAPA